MKYAFTRIESLMQSELNPENIKLQHPHPVFLNEYINCLGIQKEFISKWLLKESTSLSKEKELELFIRRHQAALIKLADEITRNINMVTAFLPATPSKKLSVIDVYQYALKCIDELLNTIENTFSQYFNWDENIPAYHKLRMQLNLGGSFRALLQAYRQAGINEDLLELMTYTIKKFLAENAREQTTYRQLSYFETLCKEYQAGIEVEKKKISQSEILKLLVYVNYNNPCFFEYYTNIIENELEDKVSIAEKIIQLSWWLKTVNQLSQHPTIGHNLNTVKAKDQLICWIKEEIFFFEKQQLLTLKSTTTGGLLDKGIPAITTSLSVKELALFTKVLIDTGLLQAENKSILIDAVIKIFKTINKDEITAGSLRKNFYANEEHTKNRLKDHLKGMINQVNEY